MRPDLRVLDNCEKIYVIGIASDRIVQQVRVRPHPELDRPGIGQRRQLGHGHDAAESARPRVDGVIPTGNEATDGRAHAVRADNEVRLNGSPVSKAEARSATQVSDLGQPVIEMQAGAPQRTTQDALEVGTMDPVIGRTANMLISCSHEPGAPRCGCRRASFGPVVIFEQAPEVAEPASGDIVDRSRVPSGRPILGFHGASLLRVSAERFELLFCAIPAALVTGFAVSRWRFAW